MPPKGLTKTNNFTTLKALVIPSWPQLGFMTKVRAWKGAGQKCNPKITFTLLGMQENVREWAHTLPNELPLWELESWWAPEFLESSLRGQNSLNWKFPYITEKFLRHRCLKCTHMIHLTTYNRNYGWKKGWESKCQFDSWPLKARNPFKLFFSWDS